MVHVIFSEADARILQEAISMDESLQGEIHIVKDDFSVGPISDLYSETGRQQRHEWWQAVFSASDPKHGELFSDEHDKMTALAELLKNNQEQQVWIWAAQNSRDVCGYYWTLHYFKEFHGRIFILYLNNLPFINEKGSIFYPSKLEEIPAKEFLKARKLSREITLSEFEVDPDEWIKLSNENKGVRILEGGKKLIQADYDFMDNELRKFVMPDWQKAHKIIHNFRHKAKHDAGDPFVTWRLKQLVETGKFDTQGNPEKMKDLEIKNKAAAPALN